MKVNFQKFRFYLSFLEPWQIKKELYSAIRGLFGHNLKKIICPLKGQDCNSCLLKQNCKYIEIFERSLKNNHKTFLKGSGTAPHPFILYPDLKRFETYGSDNPLKIELTLLGEPRDLLPYFILAFENMGGRGFGKDQRKFKLLKVCQLLKDSEKAVYSQKNPQISELEEFVPQFTEEQKVFKALDLEFLSPFRMKKDGKFITQLNFNDFFKGILKRLDELARCFGKGPLCDDFKNTLKLAEKVKISQSSLKWMDLTRYSNRQKSHMKFGGLMGRFTIEGDILPILKYLKLGEILHVGKATSFGFGNYRILEENDGR